MTGAPEISIFLLLLSLGSPFCRFEGIDPGFYNIDLGLCMCCHIAEAQLPFCRWIHKASAMLDIAFFHNPRTSFAFIDDRQEIRLVLHIFVLKSVRYLLMFLFIHIRKTVVANHRLTLTIFILNCLVYQGSKS